MRVVSLESGNPYLTHGAKPLTVCPRLSLSAAKLSELAEQPAGA
jgi:hypothetical protein